MREKVFWRIRHATPPSHRTAALPTCAASALSAPPVRRPRDRRHALVRVAAQAPVRGARHRQCAATAHKPAMDPPKLRKPLHFLKKNNKQHDHQQRTLSLMLSASVISTRIRIKTVRQALVPCSALRPGTCPPAPLARACPVWRQRPAFWGSEP